MSFRALISIVLLGLFALGGASSLSEAETSNALREFTDSIREQAPKAPAEPFSKANRFYEQGQYELAAAAYKQILKNGYASVPLYFNLGNALFKAGRTGPAIVAYRQAQSLSPRDPDVRTNLQLARSKAAAGDPARTRVWTRVMHFLTLNEWTVLAGVFFAGWFVLLFLRELNPALKETLRGYTATVGVLAAVGVTLLAGAVYDRLFVRSAVVIVPEGVVRRGPFQESQSSFTVRDGAELAVLDEKEEWLQVSDASDQIGWIQNQQVAVLASSAR